MLSAASDSRFLSPRMVKDVSAPIIDHKDRRKLLNSGIGWART